MKDDSLVQQIKNNSKNYIIDDAEDLGSYKCLKKLIKKLIAWLIGPIIKRQNAFNESVMVFAEESERKWSELYDKHYIIEELSSDMERRMDDLNHQVLLMEEYRKLEKEIVGQISQQQSELESLCKLQMKKINEHEEKLEWADIALKKNDNFWRKISVSQAGEDVIIAYILKVLGIDLKEITYLDLGANHGKDLSNTYYFYENGARGVLVEANPALIPELKLFRGEDTIVNKCVSLEDDKIVRFYVLNGDGLSTSEKENAEDAIRKNPALFIENEVDVETVTVQSLLEDYFVDAPTIMNVDIEGMEMSVLENIDLAKNRPFIIICEMIPYKTSLVIGEKNIEILTYMKNRGYKEFAFTGINSIFIDAQQLKDKFSIE